MLLLGLHGEDMVRYKVVNMNNCLTVPSRLCARLIYGCIRVYQLCGVNDMLLNVIETPSMKAHKRHRKLTTALSDSMATYNSDLFSQIMETYYM